METSQFFLSQQSVHRTRTQLRVQAEPLRCQILYHSPGLRPDHREQTAMATCSEADKCWNCSRPASRLKCQGPGGTEAQSKDRLRIQRGKRAAEQRGEVAMAQETGSVPDRPQPVVPGTRPPTRKPCPSGPSGPSRPAPAVLRTANPAESWERDEQEPERERSKQRSRPTGDQEAKRSKADHDNELSRQIMTMNRTIRSAIDERRERDRRDEEFCRSIDEQRERDRRDEEISPKAREDQQESNRRDEAVARWYHEKDKRDLESVNENQHVRRAASSSWDVAINDPIRDRGRQQQISEIHQHEREAARWTPVSPERFDLRSQRQQTAVGTAFAAGDTSSDEPATRARRTERSRTSYSIAELSRHIDGEPIPRHSSFQDLGALFDNDLLRGIYVLKDFRTSFRDSNNMKAQTTWMWAQDIINHNNADDWMDNLLLASALDRLFQMSSDPTNRNDLSQEEQRTTHTDEVMEQATWDVLNLTWVKSRIDAGIDMGEHWTEDIQRAQLRGKLNLVRAKITGNAMNLVTRKGQRPEIPVIEFCCEWWRRWSHEYQQPIQKAMFMPFLSSIPLIEHRRSCETLAAQFLLAEFLSPDFHQTGEPWRQRWNVPCNSCFELTENYRGNSQTTRCRECADNWGLRN